MPATTRTRRAAAPDAVLATAVEEARAAALDVAGPGEVGEHLGAMAVEDRVVAHRFACTARGYRGWVWSVTLARAPRARVATVSEAELVPDDGALLAPSWVPWSDRLRPGDLGATDVLPFVADDDRLEPGYTAVGHDPGRDSSFDDEADAVALWELGLGRPRVLSPVGRDEAATRWYAGAAGPDTDTARAATAACASCGFFVRMAGSLRRLFGVCANEWSPDDGRVVSFDHGCGAHSETDAAAPDVEPLPPMVLDESGYEPVART